MAAVIPSVDAIIIPEAVVDSYAGLIVIGSRRLGELVVRQHIGPDCQVRKRIVLLQNKLNSRAETVGRNDVTRKRIADNICWISRVRSARGRVKNLIGQVGPPEAVHSRLRT